MTCMWKALEAFLDRTVDEEKNWLQGSEAYKELSGLTIQPESQ